MTAHTWQADQLPPEDWANNVEAEPPYADYPPAAEDWASDDRLTEHDRDTECIDAPPRDADPTQYLEVVTASQVRTSRVVYLWDRRIPMRALTLMPGEEGIGKTTVGVRIVADLTRGTLPGELHGHPRDVIALALEDGLEDVFKPRLEYAGADLDRVHIVKHRITEDGGGTGVMIPRDLPILGHLVRKHDAAMVWIDSLVTTLPDDMKTIAYKDSAKILRALGSWAEAERIAVVAPWHLNKGSGSDTAIRMMDSRAFRTGVRSLLLVVADPEAEEGASQGIVALDKANGGTLNVPALRYRIKPAHYTVTEHDEDTGTTRDIEASCGVAHWIGELEGDGRQIARDALTPRLEREDSPEKWLRTYLTTAGETERRDLMAAADDANFSEHQIKRASKKIGVHFRTESGYDDKANKPWRKSLWSLPDKSVHKSAHNRPTHAPTTPSAPTYPPGESDLELTTSVSAGQTKSAQSVQSEHQYAREERTDLPPCPHGMHGGDQPDNFVKGRLACPRCAIQEDRA